MRRAITSIAASVILAAVAVAVAPAPLSSVAHAAAPYAVTAAVHHEGRQAARQAARHADRIHARERQVRERQVRERQAPERQRHGARHKQDADLALTAERAQMLGLINDERAQANLGPLSLDDNLNTVAQGRSQDMVDRNYFAHQIPGGGAQLPKGGMVFDILDNQNTQYEMVGENIALNNYINFYPLTRTVRETNTDLMNSPEHRANLLEPKYTKLGLGFVFEKGTGKLIVTEDFLQP